MKKKDLTSLKFNKEYISNLNLIHISGGKNNCESRIICEEPAETVGCGAETFRTYCPCNI